ncbi:MAG TPA: HD domain-containing protein [Jiangellales bacterium]|nr:HD domain-containing protein [Jiangellales bacterium]
MTRPVHPRPLPGRPVSVAGIRLPDTAAAVAAERLCANVSADVLYAHAARSFVFAVLLAQREGVTLDEEALYVGSILHDLGLTDTYRHPTTPFEYVSADVARQFTAEQGWPADRTDLVHRTIVLHMASEVGVGESAEARLLEAGVALDVTGHRLDELDPGKVRAVLLAYPRGPFVPEFSALMSEEAHQKPDSAAAALVGSGLLTRIAQAPFYG